MTCQPSVTAGPIPLVTILDASTSKYANAWNNPADHFSKLFTETEIWPTWLIALGESGDAAEHRVRETYAAAYRR